MIYVRRSEERGPTQIGWLDSRHTFSFGGYHDPRFMGFGPLRVINEDKVSPGAGFDTHSTGTWRSSPTCSTAHSNIKTRLAPAR